VFEIVAPDAHWSFALAAGLAGAALTLAVATSRARRPVKRLRALAVSATAVLVVIGIASGALSAAVTLAIITMLLACVPAALIAGLLRLIRTRGVTLQAVAGALAIYLVTGLLFGALIGFVARIQSGPYFAQAGHVSNGERVYYSFSVLTTTGFGDYSAARPLGHALAVLEVLTGQLYLVTVIGVVVGNLGREPVKGRSGSSPSAGRTPRR
jgi:hypothetical protein